MKTDSRKIKLCKMSGCHNQATTVRYCRLCYLKNWKKIRNDKKKKATKDLSRYVENIVRTSREEGVAPLQKHLKSEASFEKSLDNMLHYDASREVIVELGYRKNLDIMIDSIRVDEDF